MLTSILVYVNMCMFVYKFNVCYIVYMNSVSMLDREGSRLSHMHV